MSRFALMLVLPGLLAAATGTVSQTFEFRSEDFRFERLNGFDVVSLPGEFHAGAPGAPSLPLVCRSVVIPGDAEVTGVEVTASIVEPIAGEFDIHPSQRPMVLSKPAPAFVAPDPAVYASSAELPAERVAFTGFGQLGGYRIAGIQISPLSYLPSSRKLTVARRIDVKVSYETGRHTWQRFTREQVAADGERVRSLVTNPADVARFAPPERSADGWLCDMMVITSSAMAANFQPYVDWKNLRGYKTVIVRTESIYSTYPGRDNPERIRNCIADYWRNHGLRWVLIGGDDGIVPVRTARLTVEGNVEDIATDMYYADLQWSWDSDHNNLFGEMTDTVDFFYDVLVGRAPVDNAADVANFYAKCTTYERNPDTGYIRKALYASNIISYTQGYMLMRAAHCEGICPLASLKAQP
jgi:hypothetical protein